MTQIQSDKKNNNNKKEETSDLLLHQKPHLSPSMPERSYRNAKRKVGTGLSALYRVSVATARGRKKKVFASFDCLFVCSRAGTWPECTVSANSRLQLMLLPPPPLLSSAREEVAKLSGHNHLGRTLTPAANARPDCLKTGIM